MSQHTRVSSAKPIISECLSDCQQLIIGRRPVLTKKDFVQRYRKGEFGNAAPTWDSIIDYINSFYVGQVHVRNRKVAGETFYGLNWHEVVALYEGTNPMYPKLEDEDWYVSAMAPHDKGTIQGEVQETDVGLSLLWTHAKKPMREALAEFQRQAFRIEALTLLRTYMNPRSYGWLKYLLQEYPRHVVEFTCFSINWGTIPGYNVVFWEVRGGY